MPRIPLPLPALALAVAAAVGLAACGGEDAKLLPGETAREITANLDTVQQLSNEGDCVGAESAVQQVGEQIEALEEVDPKLKQALEQGAARLEEVIAGCEESSSEAIAPAEIPGELEGGTEREAKPKKEREAKPKEEEAPETTTSPPATGEGQSKEGGNNPPSEEAPEEGGEGSSGGVSPGTPAGEGE
jgi:hypothetical protein